MTDKECIEQIEAIARAYFEDDDASGCDQMEKIINILEEYNRGKLFV